MLLQRLSGTAAQGAGVIAVTPNNVAINRVAAATALAEDVVAGRGRLLANAEQFDDDTVLHHQAATGVEIIGGENGEGVF